MLSSKGKRIPVAEFETAYMETHVRHSNALHGHTKAGGTYLVGPLARLNLNHEQLGTIAKKAIKDAKIKLPMPNPYKAFIARAVELVQYLDEAIQIIERLLTHGTGPPGPQAESRRRLRRLRGAPRHAVP